MGNLDHPFTISNMCNIEESAVLSNHSQPVGNNHVLQNFTRPNINVLHFKQPEYFFSLRRLVDRLGIAWKHLYRSGLHWTRSHEVAIAFQFRVFDVVVTCSEQPIHLRNQISYTNFWQWSILGIFLSNLSIKQVTLVQTSRTARARANLIRAFFHVRYLKAVDGRVVVAT